MYYRTIAFLLMFGLSFAGLANESAVSPSKYQVLASHMGFPDELPHIALFSKDGSCVLQKTVHLGWSADELVTPDEIVTDSDCPRFYTDEPGSTHAAPQTHWRIQLWTLDVPSCSACEHAESELRRLLDESPDQFELEVWRVNLMP